MLRRLRIGPRLLVLIAVQAAVLLLVGAAGVLGLQAATESTETLSRRVSEGTRLGYMAQTVREDLLDTLRTLRDGAIDWAEARDRVQYARTTIDTDWQAFVRGLGAAEAEFVDDVIAPNREVLGQALDRLGGILEREDAVALRVFLDGEVEAGITPFLNAVVASTAERQLIASQVFEQALERSRLFLVATTVAIVVGLALAGLLGILIYRSILTPLESISTTVDAVSRGELTVRAGVGGSDEMADLGNALDGLLDHRVAASAQAQQENDRLNDSVIALLEAVDQLSKRDLTVTVPVSPDVTGPVADAINQMTEEMVTVLRQVGRIAFHMSQACAAVNEKATAVAEASQAQRGEVESTAKRLAVASAALGEIAAKARQCRQQAEQTTAATRAAMGAVQGTLSGMRDIREAIQETGKRIKRLGDRSQEITSIVDIIGTIAERTHMLALNASMQAAAAGEAGRGFGVVAEEVQRLAESSREATRQIGSLVRNIQVDTNDAIVTMDRTIGQVVEGTRLAESAEAQMSTSRENTGALVEAVQLIAAGSDEQARIGEEMRAGASGMVTRTRAAMGAVTEQLNQTRKLVQYAQILVRAVRVFKLPAERTDAS
ncbi:MAG: methyl-accepting chemotaxis protein [Ectothiorhodospiraceae bacterium]|nr:methyl-accepting chemotaxis protein [Chromatiales bacterium]MCP5157479.1 methyl-accepting chemotaxis protein [Ectothiorhodospiraceae bacterium]